MRPSSGNPSRSTAKAICFRDVPLRNAALPSLWNSTQTIDHATFFKDRPCQSTTPYTKFLYEPGIRMFTVKKNHGQMLRSRPNVAEFMYKVVYRKVKNPSKRKVFLPPPLPREIRHIRWIQHIAIIKKRGDEKRLIFGYRYSDEVFLPFLNGQRMAVFRWETNAPA